MFQRDENQSSDSNFDYSTWRTLFKDYQVLEMLVVGYGILLQSRGFIFRKDAYGIAITLNMESFGSVKQAGSKESRVVHLRHMRPPSLSMLEEVSRSIVLQNLPSIIAAIVLDIHPGQVIHFILSYIVFEYWTNLKACIHL